MRNAVFQHTHTHWQKYADATPPAAPNLCKGDQALSLRLVNWNVEWATPGSPRRDEILRRIRNHEPEIVCLTEAHKDLLSQEGHTISSQADYGYPIKKGRRKVLLWSRNPWEQVVDLGCESLPPGRFVSAYTQTSVGEIKVVGVCIPWSGSRTEARRGVDRKKRWEDHANYIAGFSEALNRMDAIRVVMIGDFNQRIGQGSRTPIKLQRALGNALPPPHDYRDLGTGLPRTTDHRSHCVESGLNGRIHGYDQQHSREAQTIGPFRSLRQSFNSVNAFQRPERRRRIRMMRHTPNYSHLPNQGDPQ